MAGCVCKAESIHEPNAHNSADSGKSHRPKHLLTSGVFCIFAYAATDGKRTSIPTRKTVGGQLPVGHATMLFEGQHGRILSATNEYHERIERAPDKAVPRHLWARETERYVIQVPDDCIFRREVK